MNNEKLKIIADFGKKYQKKYLYNEKEKQCLKKSLEDDWYEALKFFFSRAFMRGRRDEISVDFLNKAKNALDGYDLKNKLPNLSNNWEEELEKQLKNYGVNNKYDRKLVLSTIKFILDENNKNNNLNYNLIKYTLQKIKKCKIEEIYNALDGLTAVGDKIASFFLRDLACIFGLKIQKDKRIFLQPVDTWVGQVLEKLYICQKSDIDKAIRGNEKSLEEVRKAIIDRCDKVEISSIEFNQGAWYLGVHAFDILFENLDKIKAEEIILCQKENTD